MYRLDFREISGHLKGQAYHSLDLGMAWNEPHKNVANASAEAAMAQQVHGARVAFIRGQAPAAPGLPEWPEYKREKQATMLLNVQSRVEEKPHKAELHLWKGLL